MLTYISIGLTEDTLICCCLNFRCPECSMVIISNPHNLKRHYKRMHSEEKISCKECNETFNKKHQFVKHQAIHSASMIYKCDKCNKSYQNHRIFKRHQKIHEKTYPCPVSGCSEVFDRWLLLRKHRQIKHVTRQYYRKINIKSKNYKNYKNVT